MGAVKIQETYISEEPTSDFRTLGMKENKVKVCTFENYMASLAITKQKRDLNRQDEVEFGSKEKEVRRCIYFLILTIS